MDLAIELVREGGANAEQFTASTWSNKAGKIIDATIINCCGRGENEVLLLLLLD